MDEKDMSYEDFIGEGAPFPTAKQADELSLAGLREIAHQRGMEFPELLGEIYPPTEEAVDTQASPQ